MNFLISLILKPFKWIFSLAFTLLLVLVLALALAGFYVPFLAEKMVSHRTDFPLKIGDSHMNLFLGEVDLWDVSVKNPTRFQEPVFIEIKELSTHVNLMSLLTATKQIDRLSVNIPQLTWVKTVNGEVNTDAFVNSFTGGSSDTPKSDSAKTDVKKADAKPMNYLVKELKIHIGSVQMIDYTATGEKSKTYPVNLDLDLKDVKGTADIAGPLSLALAKSGVSILTDTIKNIIPDDLKDTDSLMQKGSEAVQKGTEAVSEAAKSVMSLF
jgi:uncharacterized protein involved in outer membrane biogenesis